MTLLSHKANEHPAEEAARLLTRIGVFLLFVVSLSVPALIGQTVYILLPIGAALLIAGASVSPVTHDKAMPLWRLLSAPPVLAAVFLIAWATVSLAWTPFANGPSERLLKTCLTLVLVAVASGFLPARTRVCDLNLLPIGVGVAALALAGVAALNLYLRHAPTVEEIVDGSALTRAGVTLALILWPAAGALALRGRWRLAGALLVVAAAAAIATGAPNVALALLAGLIAFAASLGRPRTAARVFGRAAAAAIMSAPLIALVARYAPGDHKAELSRALDIWGALTVNGGVRSLTGHGFGAALYGLFGGYLDPHTPRGLLFQIWFDLGVIGAAGLATMAWRAFAVAGGLRPALAPFLVGGLVTGLVIAALGPAAEQLWAVTAAGLAAIAYILVMRGQFRKRRPHLPAYMRPSVGSLHFSEESEQEGASSESIALEPSKT
jgi:hypothetical protein